jgi:hypothetical protein
MTEDKFLERLRNDAAQLRFDPKDDFVWTRLRAKVREGIRRPANLSQMLARWVRPIIASFAILVLGAALSVAWVERTHDSTYVAEAMTSNNPVEITVDGDTFSLAE